MEIRFCSVCNESIPDGEFDAGRAIVSGKHSQHVACALRRSVVMSGTRSWLTFALALFAAGVCTFLLVAHLGRSDTPPPMTEVPAVVESHVAAALRDSETRQVALQEAARDALRRDLGQDFDGRLKELIEGELRAALSAHEKTLRDSNLQIQERLTHLDGILDRVRQKVADLVDWKVRIQEEARQLRADLEAAKLREPTPPDESEKTPQDKPLEEPAPEQVDRAREAEIDRWIKRLSDSDEDIVFSATIELARLKALRATPNLVLVLSRHKDFYARLGAATALGEIRACNAVPDLIDALDDKDDLVRTAAAEALHRIAEEDFNFVSGLSKQERRRIQKKWRAWWRENEAPVRRRLDQPKS